ncbi:MAG: hypothetical protein FJ106_14105 [Deltaproteobacteria bacterium]|nr:hypothetical protein [Deltaproteobacteria bacterium]
MKKILFRRRTVFFNSGKEQKNHFKTFGILCLFAFMVSIMPVNVSMAAEERYKGILVVEKDGKYEIDNKDYVELVLDKGTVKSMRLHTKAAHKDIKYSDCRKLENDGSNFTKWFSIECRSIKSYDGKSAAWLEYYFAGSYVGISPEVTPQYSLYKKLKEVAEGLGLPVPSRTFVIYADKKPIFEFFCYPEDIKTGITGMDSNPGMNTGKEGQK